MVAQEQWAIPFVITEPRNNYTQLSISIAAAGTVVGSYRFALYDDPSWIGYPQCMILEPTSGAAVNSTLAIAQVVSPTFDLDLDPALYWLAVKCITAGTGQTVSRGSGPVYPSVFPNMSQTTPWAVATPAGWRLTSQGTGAMSDVFASGGVATDAAPTVAIKLT
jgi:hypothetical protein